MSDLAQRLRNLSPEKIELLLQQTQTPEGSATKSGIDRRPDPSAPAPLSLLQKRLWFLDRLEPGTPLYNMHAAFLLRGKLEAEVLLESFRDVVRRHEILRTLFEADGGEPIQRIRTEADLGIVFVDLRSSPPDERREAWQGQVLEDALYRFDLTTGPLLRVRLVRLDEDAWGLSVVLHHIVADGWSISILVRELGAFYTHRLGEEAPAATPPELPLQFADIAFHQHATQDTASLAADLDFWRQHLTGAPELLQLRSDRPRPPERDVAGGEERLRIAPPLRAELAALAARHGATLYMVLLAAWGVLLGRYSEQDDVLIGSPVAGRDWMETEGLIGPFLNTVVRRVELGGEVSFAEVLARVRQAVLAVAEHTPLAFERLVEELQPERSTSHTPLFQVWFVLHNTPRGRLELPGVTLEPLDVHSGTAKFDLTLSLEETGEELAGAIEFRSDIFDRSTVAVMARGLEALCAHLARAPELSVKELSLLRDGQEQQLLAQVRAGAVPDPAGLEVLFTALRGRDPEAEAAICQDERLLYGELERRSNQLAHHLRQVGVEAGTRVAICLPRGTDLVTALVGVLKAGGVTLVLDPSLPAERLEFLFEDTAVEVLVSIDELLFELPAAALVTELLCLDSDAAAIDDASTAVPSPAAAAADPAYVIYTSGSTGTPKGVEVCRGPLAAHLAVIVEAFGLVGADRVLQFASTSFDVAYEQILGTLAGGATLVMRGAEAWGPGELSRQATENWLTVLNLPTGYWQQWVRALNDATAPPPGDSLRLVIAGGDAMAPDAVRQWFASPLADVRLLNAYGPTEAVITATLHEVTAADMEGHRVPLGSPLPGRHLFLLDAARRPVPAGVPGEIHLGGILARGYLDRPELTAKRFVRDPFVPADGDDGVRLYCTGDLGRRRATGELEFLGRRDEQVKVRGFRIELGEVEAALSNYRKVRQAVVLVRGTTAEDKELVGFLVPVREDEKPSGPELREFLLDVLPDYAVPGIYVVLNELPQTPSGKVDRRALAANDMRDAERGAAQEERVAPRDETEKAIAEIWEEVLRVPEPGIYDSFFDLGGHSLLGMQVISRILAKFGVDLPIQDLFIGPTVAQLAHRVTACASARVDTMPPLHRVDRHRPLPLSLAQQRLWILDRLHPGSPVYNIPGALRLTGRLRIEALWGALAEVVRRHESFRTVFATVDDEPVQAVEPNDAFRLPLIDLGELPAGNRERELHRLMAQEAQRPFNLAFDTCFRARLLRLGEEDHTLLVTMHHIASDGWSMGILKRETRVLYQAALEGRPSPLAALPVQYADFAVWQRSSLVGERLKTRLDYWRRQLAGASAALELPTDRPRPAIPSQRGASLDFELPDDVSEAVVALSRRREVTSFMTLLAVFKVLLARLSGQRDLSVGTPVAGRTRVELEGLIGFFVNTLVLRSRLAGDPSFEDVLDQVRGTALEAQQHQDLPFEKLVEELRPQRHLSHSPFFQVWFTLQNVPQEDFLLPELRTETLTVHSATSKFDLVLSIVESAEGLPKNLNLEYSTDIFEAQTLWRHLEHFRTLLHEVVVHPGRRLSELSFLTETERRELLVAHNATTRPYPGDRPVHDLFADAARRVPEAVALVARERQLSHGELDRASSQLAHRLRALGIGRASRVGLHLESSPELVVAMLGVLKSGAAYVPLDPRHPRRYVESALREAEASVLLTQRSLAARLSGITAVTLCLDGVSDAGGWPFANESTTAPAVVVWPEEVAYVIFTSGTSGEAKGVEIGHRALTNYVWWARETYVCSPGESFACCSSPAFDLTVTTIYPPLLNGNRVVFYAVSGPEPAVEEVMRDNRVDVVKLTPSHLALIGQRDNKDSRIRRLIVGGEALTVKRAREVAASFARRVEILNEYGPTEATVGCLWHRFDAVRDGRPAVPIGLPAANVRIYVLDKALRPVAENVVGELWLAGDSLARGYLKRGALTAASFRPDPFVANRRMYKSGDLVRWLPRGVLEWVGRCDAQIKFHGYRVEPEGISRVLVEHPEIRDSVVVAHRDGRGNESLVAYYVSPRVLAMKELRSFMAEWLIAEMVPNLFLHMTSLPLTPQGKIDRSALPAIEPERRRLGGDSGTLRTPTEELLSGIWTQVLGIERIGADAHFFELGGHSLLATQVISRIREGFGVELSLRTFFEEPGLREMSRRIDHALRHGESPEAMPIAPVPRENGRSRELLPLSFAQQRIWFVHKLDGNDASYNVPSMSYLYGRLDAAALEASFVRLVARHETLRTSFVEVDGKPWQRVSAMGDWHLPLCDLHRLEAPMRERELRRLAEREVARPFDLERGPLLRVVLLRLEEREQVLLITLHHIVTDGWSMGVLMQELMDLYEASVAGLPPALPELPIQYGDFAVWQRRWLAGKTREIRLEYWKSQLAGTPPLIELPTDRPRPARPSHRGALEPLALAGSLSDSVRRFNRRYRSTHFVTLLTAFQTWLHFVSGFRDVVVGTDIANRNRTETEGLIGFFVNQLVLRTSFDGNPTGVELLDRVREMTLAAFEHQDVPFEQVVDARRLERRPGQTPFFEVKLIFQNVPIPELELPGLTLTPVDFDTKTAQLDFILALWDTPQGLRGWYNYKTDLWSAAAALRMVAAFEEVLSRLIEEPQVRLDERRRRFAEFERQQQSVAAADLGRATQRKFLRLRPVGKTPERT